MTLNGASMSKQTSSRNSSLRTSLASLFVLLGTYLLLFRTIIIIIMKNTQGMLLK